MEMGNVHLEISMSNELLVYQRGIWDYSKFERMFPLEEGLN